MATLSSGANLTTLVCSTATDPFPVEDLVLSYVSGTIDLTVVPSDDTKSDGDPVADATVVLTDVVFGNDDGSSAEIPSYTLQARVGWDANF